MVKKRKKNLHSFLQYEEKGKGKKSKSSQIDVNNAVKDRRIIQAGNGNAPAKKGAPSQNSSKRKKNRKRKIPAGKGNAPAKKEPLPKTRPKER